MPRIGYGKHILEQQAKQRETKPITRKAEAKFAVQQNELKFGEESKGSEKPKAKSLHQTQSVPVKKIVKDESYSFFHI